MVRINEEFLTKDSAIRFLNDIKRKFPVTEFGTKLSLKMDRISRHWEVNGHRFEIASA